ncbi:peptidylprolyl isomerase, partial [Streptomyces sp. S9]|nr:peptidylprolyl isomerase [Streptomyces sp. S9]
RDELLVQRLRQRFAQTRVSVSEAEIDAALAAQANTGTQYHLAHILISLPEGATAEQIATAQKKVDGVKTLIDKGEMDFNAAAVRYSDSPNALEGGDLGWRSVDEIPAAFAELMKSMKAGDVTQPLRGP